MLIASYVMPKNQKLWLVTQCSHSMIKLKKQFSVAQKIIKELLEPHRKKTLKETDHCIFNSDVSKKC